MRKTLFLFICCIYANVFALTPLDSDAGSKMLTSSISSGYASQFLTEIRYFTPQQNLSFCSIATSSIILNTLGVTPPNDNNFGKYKIFTQNNLFTPELLTKTGINAAYVKHGLKLAEEAKLLNSFPGIAATAYSTESLTLTQTRTLIVNALKSNTQLVIANIFRGKMDESGGGHFSPVAAYEAKSDNVLFMDVAAFKHGPTWVPMTTLYNAMHTKDGNTYRGFILVGKEVK